MTGYPIRSKPAPAVKTGADWRIIGGKRHYFRSKWEANFARYLELAKRTRTIKEWEYEPCEFWFDGIRRGVCSYKPDFRVTEINGSQIYYEVKGYMDSKSKTKLKRMAKYHPHIKLIVIDGKFFKKNNPLLKKIIKEWE